MFRTPLYSNEYFISTISCHWSLPIPPEDVSEYQWFSDASKGYRKTAVDTSQWKKNLRKFCSRDKYLFMSVKNNNYT